MMRRIYEPGSLMEGQMLLSMLASEGVQAYLAGRDLLGAMGELPAMGLLGVMVENHQAEDARRLIAEYTSALPVPGDEPENHAGELLC
jgi:hypothetical protein